MLITPEGYVKTKCDQCMEMWQERNERGIEGEPPCETCRVDLLPENEIVASIYLIVRGQVLTRSNGEYNVVTDLNQVALWNAIDHWPKKIENPMEVFERVRNVFYHFLKKEME